MWRYTSEYLRQVGRRLLLVGLVVGIFFLGWECEGWTEGRAESAHEAARNTAGFIRTVLHVVAVGSPLMLAFLVTPTIALLLASLRGRTLWLISTRESKRFPPEQLLPLRVGRVIDGETLEFGAIYEDRPLDRPWLLAVLRNIALASLTLPMLPLVVSIRPMETAVLWILATGGFSLGSIMLWWSARSDDP